MRYLAVLSVCATFLVTLGTAPGAEGPPQGVDANSHPVYTALRNVSLSGDAYPVQSLVLEKDAATFTLTGTWFPLEPVEGRATGGVFLGEGTMAYVPPTAAERAMLRHLTKGEEFHETFQRAVFRFTDDTATLLAAAPPGPAKAPPSQATNTLKDIHDGLRVRLRENLHARILHDILSPASGGLFHAYVAGRKYSNRLAYMIDPRGAGSVSPEEVQLLSWADSRGGIFAAHHYRDSYSTPVARTRTPGTWIDIQHHVLHTSIEQSGELSGDATTTFTSLVESLAAVPFSLFPTLRVSSVTGPGGESLAWIQESKDEDADYWVILPRPLARGETFTVRTLYRGRDAVVPEGGDNYFPVARSNWYPNSSDTKDYATYDKTFSVPRRLRLVATADFVDERVEADRTISRWRADYPLSVAGFTLGLFQTAEAEVGDTKVVALANTQPSDSTKALMRIAETSKMAVGSLTTTGSNKMAMSEAQVALQLYTDYFGPISLKRVHVTQQGACNYGQAWPGVLYIPTCYYWGPTVRQQIGMQQTNPGYWDSVTAHEVAHLWWGHTVGWHSYRDQWMSEGFSNLSASLFLQAAYPKEPQRFREFWQKMLTDLTSRNRFGVRPIDAGPVTQGFRLNSARTGAVAGAVMYPKGAYILHMLRMMMWNRDTGDAPFKEMMREFVATHRNQPVSTDDFQAVVEKHMLPDMDADGDGTMNWFFRQYVHDTPLPTYRLQQTVGKRDGQTVLSVKVTQSNVHDRFVMLVPIYIELQDGRAIRLGSARLRGNTTFEQEMPLGQTPVRRAMLNHYHDVLGLEER